MLAATRLRIVAADPAPELAAALAPLDLVGRLRAVRAAVPGRIVFTLGFGREGMAIFHALATGRVDIAVVTLDTGRLFEETHALWAEAEERWRLPVNAVTPDPVEVAALVAADGANGFRRSVAAREACCHVRKIAPLVRALGGASAWVTGLSQRQSSARAATPLAEWDAGRALLKVNPLADWDADRLSGYLADHRVPVNPLHARGFASIGCMPCTRAVVASEDERAGRWWWEGEAAKECGIHLRPRKAAGIA